MSMSAPGCPRCGLALDAAAERCPSCGMAFGATTVTGADGSASEPQTAQLSPGVVLASRYEIERRLGRGGMGAVYMAHDRVLGETVAVKLLRPDRLADERIRDRFKSEIRLARKVRHPNVCSIYEFGEAAEGPFISMELIEGSNLWQTLRKGPLPRRQAFDLAVQVAEGLQAVHDAGVVHRDLKSANFMLDPAGRVRLMDFGIAAREDGGAAIEPTIVGTPAYMSPEQAQGRRVGPRSDIYALGLVVFEMFTGRRPARPQPHDAVALDDPLLPDAIRPILERALAVEPSARYATARAVAHALRAAWAEEPPRTPVGPAPAAARPVTRAIWALGLGAALLLAAATVVARRFVTDKEEAGPITAADIRSPASLLVVVHPWGELEVDGKPVGTTPLDWLSVPAGPHRVRIHHPTLGVREASVTLGPGERRRLVVDLRSHAARRK